MAVQDDLTRSAGGSVNGSVASILAEMEADLEKGVLSPRVYSDPDLHQAELERIFARCWVFVGHVSEIPTPGDYVLRYAGEDQFILVRDEDGEIQLLFNNCMHRASPVCRAEKGNASHFRCPYHGWIYKNSGTWNGAPHRSQAYRKLDPEAWGLRKAPHVDVYQDLIFVCLHPEARPLREYLGDMCWYLDVLLGLNDEGMSVMGDPHRWTIPSNWKSGAENFGGDFYHFPATHESAFDIGLIPSRDTGLVGSSNVRLEGGHGVMVLPRTLPEPYGIMAYPPEVTETFDLSRLTEGQRKFLEDGNSVIGATIFPNLSWHRVPGTTDRSKPPTTYTRLLQWQPRGPGHLELWSWPLAWNAAPESFNEDAYAASIFNFGPAGIFEQDDTVVWSGGPRAGRSVFARQVMKLNYQLGLDGMSDCETKVDFLGPGEATTTAFSEANHLGFWRRWRELLATS